MDKIGAQDSALRISQLLELMWGVHSKYEGMNEHDIVLYKLGIQTFLLEALQEAKSLRESLEVDADYLNEDDN